MSIYDGPTKPLKAPRGSTGFHTELTIRAITPTTWVLTAPLTWTGTKGDTFTVPPGFITDFATVPRFLHWLILPYGAYTRAAVLHDWLLVSLADWLRAPDSSTPAGPPANSRDADGIFRRAMADLGVPWLKRWTMWAAVRAGALRNPRRAYGRDFGKDAPAVVGMALLVAPLILPGVVGVLISLGLVRVFTWTRTGGPALSRRAGARPE